jgi:3-oxoacyl-[acyl-carrier-protein] synthase-3
MRFRHVCVEALAYTLPGEIVTSDQIEQWLAPLYQRLRLPAGRLEMMSGIRQRRLWPRGSRISDGSIETGRLCLTASGIDPGLVGCLVHGSVCRDQLEPATACRVHHGLSLPAECLVYDVSNACLGLLNGIVQVATLIELGAIRAGLVVGTEDSRPLLESTLDTLCRDPHPTRESIKPAFASLTIGSASAAVLLVHETVSRTGSRLRGGVARAHSAHHALCAGGFAATPGRHDALLMQTQAEQLLEAGLAAGQSTFEAFLETLGWGRGELERTICHQVGRAHRQRMLQALQLPLERDFAIYPDLGNTGSVALPLAWALAADGGFLLPGAHVALLGIGSGINCLMLGVEWQTTPVLGQDLAHGPGNAQSDVRDAQVLRPAVDVAL